MEHSGDDHIAQLLRLKRYEQPPPGYFENFLHEFRRRRCYKPLRQSPWRICFESARDFVFSHSLWSLAYTGAAMVAVVAGSVIISMQPQQPDTTQFAIQASPVPIRPPIVDKEVEPASLEMHTI